MDATGGAGERKYQVALAQARAALKARAARSAPYDEASHEVAAAPGLSLADAKDSSSGGGGCSYEFPGDIFKIQPAASLFDPAS